MRILLLTTSFPVHSGSSSGVFVQRLARQLGRHCALQVLTPAGQRDPDVPVDAPYRLHAFRYAPRRLQLLAHGGGGIPAALDRTPLLGLLVPFFLAAMLFACLRDGRRADLLFANWSICGAIAGLAGALLRVPVVTTIRGEDANRAQTSRVHRFLLKLCLLRGGRLVAVSDDIAGTMRAMFPERSRFITMIANGVDFPGSDEAAGGLPRTGISLLTVGSLIPRKSLHTALHALALLPSEYSLTVVGEGPEREALARLARELGLADRVRLRGHVPPEQVHDCLSGADVFVFTSRSEGRPNAVLEAMAAALPVISTDIPGVRELVTDGDNGLLFPVDDAAALAERLLAIADPAVRRRMGDASRQGIIDRGLSWDKAARAYIGEFEAALAARAS